MNERKSEIRTEPIDIEAILRLKNPKLARWIPGFFVRYLKRIVHEDYVNEILEKHGNKLDIQFVEACISDFNVTIKTQGDEHLPESGRFIFAANHPLGGFDGLVLIKLIHARYGELRYLVNDLLMNLTNIRGLFVPINKHGRFGNQAADEMHVAYNSSMQILTFPAGLVSRKIKGRIVDLSWKKSVITKAIKYQRDIIPVHFNGSNTRFFYALAKIRKILGIRANLEMLYLADETFKHHNKKLTIKFGKPIPWQTFDKSKKPEEWAFWVKQKVYELDGITDLTF